MNRKNSLKNRGSLLEISLKNFKYRRLGLGCCTDFASLGSRGRCEYGCSDDAHGGEFHFPKSLQLPCFVLTPPFSLLLESWGRLGVQGALDYLLVLDTARLLWVGMWLGCFIE